MKNLDSLFARLSQSKFRSSFKLKGRELSYLREKGIDTVLEHASDFIDKRLSPPSPKNDGKQTPYGKHPVFVAQHATGTCCRGCLEKWYGIKKYRGITQEEKEYILLVLKKWLSKELTSNEVCKG